MKVQITIVDRSKNCRIYHDIEDWETCNTWQEVYKFAVQECGRCVSKVCVDRKDGTTKHVGWCFEKRIQYDDCNDTYLQEAWIVPLKNYRTEIIVEYAL